MTTSTCAFSSSPSLLPHSPPTPCSPLPQAISPFLPQLPHPDSHPHPTKTATHPSSSPLAQTHPFSHSQALYHKPLRTHFPLPWVSSFPRGLSFPPTFASPIPKLASPPAPRLRTTHPTSTTGPHLSRLFAPLISTSGFAAAGQLCVRAFLQVSVRVVTRDMGRAGSWGEDCEREP